MTRVVKLATVGGKQLVRLFSLRGAHLLAMFARTDKAKEFRVWVLNILDAEVAKPVRQQMKTYHFPVATAVPHDVDRAFGSVQLDTSTLLNPRNRCPELELIAALERDGHDVMGAKMRILAMRDALEYFQMARARIAIWEDALKRISGECGSYAQERGISVLYTRPPNPANELDRICFPHQLAKIG